MTKGDAAADSVDEIFASVLRFNMGETSPDGNDSIFSSSTLGAQKKSTAELLLHLLLVASARLCGI